MYLLVGIKKRIGGFEDNIPAIQHDETMLHISDVVWNASISNGTEIIQKIILEIMIMIKKKKFMLLKLFAIKGN